MPMSRPCPGGRDPAHAGSQPKPESHDHGAMNHGGGHQGMVMASHRIPLQQVVGDRQGAQGHPGCSIPPPTGEHGVYTIAVFADDPRNDATLHIDQYSGKVLADVRWRDYGPVAKTVETGVMLHGQDVWLASPARHAPHLPDDPGKLGKRALDLVAPPPTGRLAPPPARQAAPCAVPSPCWCCSEPPSPGRCLHGGHLAAGQP